MKLMVPGVFFVVLYTIPGFAQKVSVQSPNQKIVVSLYPAQKTDIGEWHINASCNNNGSISEVIPRIDLGLLRSDQDFSNDLKFLKASKPFLINEQYATLHGKKSVCINSANELTVSFENKGKAKLNIIIRAYNDGIASRYEFPEKQGAFVMKDELTSFTVPKETLRWMEIYLY